MEDDASCIGAGVSTVLIHRHILVRANQLVRKLGIFPRSHKERLTITLFTQDGHLDRHFGLFSSLILVNEMHGDQTELQIGGVGDTGRAGIEREVVLASQGSAAGASITGI